MREGGDSPEQLGGWHPVLRAQGKIPSSTVRRSLGLVGFMTCLTVAVLVIYYSIDDGIETRVTGFGHFFYSYGHWAGVGVTLGLMCVVGYGWMLNSGKIPLLWARSDARVPVVATPLGRLKLRGRRLRLDGQLEVHVWRDRVNPDIRVIDFSTPSGDLRVRRFGEIPGKQVRKLAAEIKQLGISVTVDNELDDD